MCVFSFYLQLIMINIPQDSMGGSVLMALKMARRLPDQ